MKRNFPVLILKCAIFFCLVFASVRLQAQEASDLYLFSLMQTSDGHYHVYAPKFLSTFNRGGYTNQPFFTPGGDLLVSVRKNGEDQNDIWRLSPPTRKLKRMTDTRSSEFSPQWLPEQNGISVLRQMPGDHPVQQVWRIAATGEEYSCLTPDVKDIGYYTWMDQDELALARIEGESLSLFDYALSGEKSRKVIGSIGRSLQSDAKGDVFYVHKFSDQFWYIKKYNRQSAILDIISETPGKADDFAMDHNGVFFMGAGSVLYYFIPGQSESWTSCGDLAIYGISHISRLAINANSTALALVSTKK